MEKYHAHRKDGADEPERSAKSARVGTTGGGAQNKFDPVFGKNRYLVPERADVS